MPKPASHRESLGKRATFLASLKMGHTVTEAARAAAINRRTAYDWRDQDAEFRAAWDDAIKESVEVLEAEVRARALDREDKQSYILLMFLLKKHDPSYRENYKKEVHVTHEKVQEISFSQQELDDALNILTQQKEVSKPEEPAS